MRCEQHMFGYVLSAMCAWTCACWLQGLANLLWSYAQISAAPSKVLKQIVERMVLLLEQCPSSMDPQVSITHLHTRALVLGLSGCTLLLASQEKARTRNVATCVVRTEEAYVVRVYVDPLHRHSRTLCGPSLT